MIRKIIDFEEIKTVNQHQNKSNTYIKDAISKMAYTVSSITTKLKKSFFLI